MPSDDWEVHADTHPDQRLISDATFDELQMIFLCNRKKVGDVENGSFYLTGLVYCESCGYKMVLKNSQVHSYYGCRHSGLGCNNRKNIRSEALDEAIIGHLFERANLNYSDASADVGAEQEDPEILKLRHQIQGIDDLISLGSNPSLQQTKHALEQELAEKLNPDRTLAFIQATAEHIICHPQARELAFWYTLSKSERTVIYDKLVSHVTVSAGKVISVTLKI